MGLNWGKNVVLVPNENFLQKMSDVNFVICNSRYHVTLQNYSWFKFSINIMLLKTENNLKQ